MLRVETKVDDTQVLYIISFLDRVNVGFAKLQMSADIGLSDAIFGLGAGIFFIGYAACEIPSNLLLQRFGARFWIARILIVWGIISVSFMFVTTPAQFLTLRFLLGIAEAGFYPGIVLYLTYWFPSKLRSQVLSLFFIGIPIAGLIGGPLSGFIMKSMTDVFGIKMTMIYLKSSDVLHSFYIPDFLFKRDVFPYPEKNDTDNVFQTTVQRQGAFVGRCAELCGTYHSMMNFEMRALSPELFDRYLALRAQTNPQTHRAYTAGEALAQLNCGELCAPEAVTTSPFDTDRTAREIRQARGGH